MRRTPRLQALHLEYRAQRRNDIIEEVFAIVGIAAVAGIIVYLLSPWPLW